MVLQHHPDVGGDEKEFRRIAEAYDECQKILSERAMTNNSYGRRSGHRRGGSPASLRGEARNDFERALHVDDIQNIFAESIDANGHCAFLDAPTDRDEPLLLCLRAYSRVQGLGYEHLRLCLRAIEDWVTAIQTLTGSMGVGPPREVYHYLLTMYSGDEAQEIALAEKTEHAARILDSMSERGLDVDDWTMFLATKIFRSSPSPSW